GIFIFGTIIGSFLNVVILRYGKISLNGRSICPSCKETLRWFELVPVLSFIFLRGKCQRCHKKISWQYPLVEIVTGTLFLSIFNFQFLIFKQFPIFNFQLLNLILLWLIFSLLIIIFVYDLYHKIIPDCLVFLFSGLALLNFLILDFQGFGFYLTNNLWAGPILAFPFAFLWFISGGRWMGLGDAKLALGIGFFLGLVEGSSALILGVWIGAVVGLFLIALSKVMKGRQLFFKGKNFTIKSELPFAPFLIIGTLLVFFFGWDVWGLGSFLL
ncbi:MAG: prepilin peptidase, partial [Patescibacteria group bacterium]|nr:prepilin peptidase [Patescibacteria group bacterium]